MLINWILYAQIAIYVYVSKKIVSVDNGTSRATSRESWGHVFKSDHFYNYTYSKFIGIRSKVQNHEQKVSRNIYQIGT